MAHTSSDIATMKRLRGEIDRLNISIADTNKKIAAENVNIARKNGELHRATTPSQQRSIQLALETCVRNNASHQKRIADFAAQIQRKTAEYNRILQKA